MTQEAEKSHKPTFNRERILLISLIHWMVGKDYFKEIIIPYEVVDNFLEEKQFTKQKTEVFDSLSALQEYYTPNREDIRVGYEYQIFEDFDILPEKIWHKFIHGIAGTDNPENMTHPFPIKEGRIRTLYLTKEQIEAEGWSLGGIGESWFYKKLAGVEYSDGEYFLDNNFIPFNDYELHYNFHTKKLIIQDQNRETLYNGGCPSINEFRTIIKLLGL